MTKGHYYTPQQIIEILHSIETVRLDKCNLIEVRQKDDIHFAYATSFEYGSFTYDLLSLIEKHLKVKE